MSAICEYNSWAIDSEGERREESEMCAVRINSRQCNDIMCVHEQFPCAFRKSTKTTKKGEWTQHANAAPKIKSTQFQISYSFSLFISPFRPSHPIVGRYAHTINHIEFHILKIAKFSCMSQKFHLLTLLSTENYNLWNATTTQHCTKQSIQFCGIAAVCCSISSDVFCCFWCCCCRRRCRRCLTLTVLSIANPMRVANERALPIIPW